MTKVLVNTLTQEQFAPCLAFNVATATHSSALVLSNLIDRAPETVMQTLDAA